MDWQSGRPQRGKKKHRPRKIDSISTQNTITKTRTKDIFHEFYFILVSFVNLQHSFGSCLFGSLIFNFISVNRNIFSILVFIISLVG